MTVATVINERLKALAASEFNDKARLELLNIARHNLEKQLAPLLTEIKMIEADMEQRRADLKELIHGELDVNPEYKHGLIGVRRVKIYNYDEPTAIQWCEKYRRDLLKIELAKTEWNRFMKDNLPALSFVSEAVRVDVTIPRDLTALVPNNVINRVEKETAELL